MKQEMIDELDKFFSQKTVQDIDRNSFLICNLFDRDNKITISLVFLRDCCTLESDSYNSVVIHGKGVVYTFPSYWISVPKELCMTYFQYIIDDFYKEDASTWISERNDSSDSGGDTSTGGSLNNCPCKIV